ncbi:MAG: hypothetical protein CVU48_06650 [Candidatus Cloacimonetes bacterium HGW-Cloacimonetes-1]|jgi:ABC-type transport system involved in cytochrome bd biosynthesis fused ATPase/permease subunit|nr:MAG: hypothetical protein CVU48_06650 [Candidatus Cloacimonetes bacterium HGW-Cloacimonetes-1]
MFSTIDLIEQYGEDYLICDGNHPLISAGSLSDEFQIYNIQFPQYEAILTELSTLTGKKIGVQYASTSLSGGQKTMLMVLTALASDAPKILFYNIMTHLDAANRDYVPAAIDNCKSKQVIVL